MSIYATLGVLYFDRGRDEAVRVYIQGVPPHIDHEGPAWDWLPPPIPPNGIYDDDYTMDPKWDDDAPYRAVVFVAEGTKKGTEKCGQQYVDPLLIITGKEYMTIPFVELYERLAQALDPKEDLPLLFFQRKNP